MRIETNLVCIQICISNSSPPFKEMYTWLGRIRDRQLPVSMMIDEEGSGAYLIAKESEKEKIEFSIEAWKYNSPYDTYLKTIIDPQVLVKTFHNEIVSLIEKQLNETKPSFIVHYENLNWNRLLENPNKPQDWNKRLAIYGGGEGKHQKTNLDNFSLTLKQEYLLKLRYGIHKISQSSFRRRKEELGKLVSFYQELAVDITLDEIDPDWYEKQQEKLNAKYKIDNCLKGKTRKERIQENEKQRNLR